MNSPTQQRDHLALFARATAHLTIGTRKMFGFPCAFTGGQMFLYVYHDGLVLRLSPEDRERCLEGGATPFAPKGGRGMREYVVLPDAMSDDHGQLEAWVNRAFAYASSLPAKTPKPKTPRPKTPR